MSNNRLTLAHPRRAVLRAAALSAVSVAAIAKLPPPSASATTSNPVSIADFGGLPGGDCTIAIARAFAASDHVVVPAGNYSFGCLKLPSGRELTLEGADGASLRLNSGVNQPAIIVPADSTLHLDGGTYDFNAAGQSTGDCHGIHFMYGGRAGNKIENTVLENSHDNLIYAANVPSGTVRNCSMVDPGLSAVLVDAGSSDIQGWTVTGNLVDKSRQGSSIPCGGIRIHGTSGGGRVLEAEVSNNHVHMPSGATDPGFIGIEMWNTGGTNGVISGNRVEGGYMCISVDHSDATTIKGNFVTGASVYTIELAAATGTQVVSNHVDGGGYGLVCQNWDKTRNATIQSNYFTGQTHSCVTITDGASGITLDSNYFDSRTGLQLQLLSIADGTQTFTNNVFECGALSNNVTAVLAERGAFTMTGNEIRNAANGLSLVNRGSAPSDAIISNNTFTGCGININEVGSMGTLSINNNGYQ